MNNVLEGTYLVAMDVRSLYTNIPNVEEIAAAKRTLDENSSETVAAKVINNFLSVSTSTEQFRF